MVRVLTQVYPLEFSDEEEKKKKGCFVNDVFEFVPPFNLMEFVIFLILSFVYVMIVVILFGFLF